MVGIANVLEQTDKLQEALKMYQKVLDIRMARFSGKGRLVSSSQQAVASVLTKLDRIEDSEVFWDRALIALGGLNDLSEEAEVEV
jgi:ribosome maturation protein Sdo1